MRRILTVGHDREKFNTGRGPLREGANSSGLGISDGTVKLHVKDILHKHDVHSNEKWPSAVQR